MEPAPLLPPPQAVDEPGGHAVVGTGRRWGLAAALMAAVAAVEAGLMGCFGLSAVAITSMDPAELPPEVLAQASREQIAAVALSLAGAVLVLGVVPVAVLAWGVYRRHDPSRRAAIVVLGMHAGLLVLFLLLVLANPLAAGSPVAAAMNLLVLGGVCALVAWALVTLARADRPGAERDDAPSVEPWNAGDY